MNADPFDAALRNINYFHSIVLCIIAVCVDPFFLYIPFLSHTNMCLGINKKLWKVAVGLRTYEDLALVLKIILQYKITKKSKFSILWTCMRCFAIAPIPQVLFSEKFILKTLRGYTFWNLSLFCQYGTRLLLIFLWCEHLKTRVSATTLGRFNAQVYLCLYLIVGQLIGASWYYLSIKRQVSCWNHACKIDTGCVHGFFHCDGTTTSTLNSTLVNEFCPINPPNATVFDYGIYLDAFQSGIVDDKGVLNKFLRCFFWGLRNLSSFASNLQTSTDGVETSFAIIISIVALILLIYIIGNIQRYAELSSARSERIVDKMELIKPKIKQLGKIHNLETSTRKSIEEHIQEAFENGSKSFNLEWLHFPNDVPNKESLKKDLCFVEEWVSNGQPDNQGKAKKWLSDNKIFRHRQNILFYLTCRLKDNEDVNLTSVLSVLPDESKWRTMKDLCFNTLKKVQGLQNIDEKWFISISTILKPVVYPKDRYIVQQGEPLDFIIFITNGIAKSQTPSPDAGGNITLKKGDFFGGELPQRKLEKIRELGSSCFPTSTVDVKSDTQVEAFVLKIEDLNNWTYPTQVEALSSDFPVESRSANSATEGVGSSSRTEEGGSKQIEIKME